MNIEKIKKDSLELEKYFDENSGYTEQERFTSGGILATVLRYKAGQRVILFDGGGDEIIAIK